MAGEIQLSGTLARPMLAALPTPQVVYLLLEAHTAPSLAHVQMPVNVGFVLDHSGSMKGDKIRCVRDATQLALSLMGPQDIVSVVIFDHRREVLIPSQSVNNVAELQRQVGKIKDAGGTKIAPALEAALIEVRKGMANAITRLIVLTDGQTEGENDCLRAAEESGKLGIPLTALGVGDDWNEDLLIEMANRSGGVAEYFSNPNDIGAFFQGAVQQAQAAVVQNAALSLRLVQGVEPRAVWQVTPLIQNLGYKPISDRAVGVALGDISKDERRLVLVELLVDAKQPGQYRIGQAEVNYDVPQLGLTGAKTKFDVMLNFVADPAQATGVVPQVMNIVEKVSAHKLQTRALEDLAAGNVGAATQKLQGAVTRLLNQGELELAQTMQTEIENLQQKGEMTSAGQKTIKFGTRKTVRLSELDLPQE